jgi:hypothetical protein
MADRINEITVIGHADSPSALRGAQGWCLEIFLDNMQGEALFDPSSAAPTKGVTGYIFVTLGKLRADY